MHTIAIYRTAKKIGRSNKSHRQSLDYINKRSILQWLLLDIQDETIEGLMELSLTNKEDLADVLSKTLDSNKGTMGMN